MDPLKTTETVHCEFDIEFNGSAEDLIERIIRDIESYGGYHECDTNSGIIHIRIPVLGLIIVNYTIIDNVINIKITRKPTLISCERIEEELRGYIKKQKTVFDFNASRSVNATVINQTDLKLLYTGRNMRHGILLNGTTIEIRPHNRGTWRAESDGVGTGVAGTVSYRVADTSNVFQFDFDNPFIGSNEYSAIIPATYRGVYEVIVEGGSGNDANVVYILRRR